MRLSKYSHACVRIGSLVIDPGEWSEAEALTEADAVLLTHEHPDHVNVELLQTARESNPKLRIYSHADVLMGLAGIDNTDAVTVADTWNAAGCEVRAVGGKHAEVYGGQPDCVNLGYLIEAGDSTVYHPGDSFYIPEEAVDVLLVPIDAPWMKLAEAVNFVRQVGPRQAHPIHDGLLNARGWHIADMTMSRLCQSDYSRIPLGSSIER